LEKMDIHIEAMTMMTVERSCSSINPVFPRPMAFSSNWTTTKMTVDPDDDDIVIQIMVS